MYSAKVHELMQMSNKNVVSTYYANQSQHWGNGQDLTVCFAALLPSERDSPLGNTGATRLSVS